MENFIELPIYGSERKSEIDAIRERVKIRRVEPLHITKEMVEKSIKMKRKDPNYMKNYYKMYKEKIQKKEHCELCNTDYMKYKKDIHFKTNKHKQNEEIIRLRKVIKEANQL